MTTSERHPLTAHDRSVDVALNELEKYVQARMGGNHPACTTGRMVAAKFQHDSARDLTSKPFELPKKLNCVAQ
jgi:TrwC relaxase